jgi:hypothetical protein
MPGKITKKLRIENDCGLRNSDWLRRARLRLGCGMKSINHKARKEGAKDAKKNSYTENRAVASSAQPKAGEAQSYTRKKKE